MIRAMRKEGLRKKDAFKKLVEKYGTYGEGSFSKVWEKAATA